jgi:hypothetical protein
MKTNIFLPKKTSLYSLFGFLSILLTSCGSYQNSSYYESDGIYGTTTRPVEKTVENNPNTQYQDYFNSLQNNNQPTEIFTDVDNYGNYDSINDSIQVTNPSYSGWGSSPENVSVSFYDNGWNNWYGSSWGWGFGFNNWYGSWGYPYYGWGYPYYGWGYPSYGWGYPNYGYNNYAYNSGRRGSNYSNNIAGNRNYSNRNYSQNRNNQTDFRRNSNVISRPNYTNMRNNSFQPRNSSNAYPTRTRVNTNMNTNSRNQNYAPSRSSYSPSSSNSSSGRSSGGGGGGGRSYGGGGRGGRG